MRRPYLLIAGHGYYPQDGTKDWIGCYETKEEAESLMTREQQPLDTFSKGPRKGQVKPNQPVYYKYINYLTGIKYDWYEIVDLYEWTK